MKKTKKRTKKSSKRSAYIALIIILGSLAFFAGMGSGILQYGLSTVGCMKQPVAATRFMGADSYDLPGDVGYDGPSPFNEYYCSEQEAIKAGFHRHER